MATRTRRAAARFRSAAAAAGATWLVATVAVLPLAAQGTGTLVGTVVDTDGRPLPDAAVVLERPPDTVAVRVVAADRLGRFRLAGLAPGTWRVRALRIGYADGAAEVRILPGDPAERSVVLTLAARPVALGAVAVDADRERSRMLERAGETRLTLERRELKSIPGAGEPDVLRAVQVLPGVVTTSDFSAAFNVRGGSADQNLILLDGIPIFNPFHLGGLFSVFNTDMLAGAELLAGGFPASYGGRVSSVLEVESDATGSGTTVDAGVSLLATRVAVGTALPLEGVGLTRARGRLSARRSYFDKLLGPFFEFPYHLVDVQGYVEGWTAGGARLSVTGYTGRDVLDLRGVDFPLAVRWRWGNDVLGARWSQPMAGGRMLDARVGWTEFDTGIAFPQFSDTEFASRIRQALARTDLTLPAGAAVTVRAGAQVDAFAYRNVAASGGTDFRRNAAEGTLLGGYGQADWRPAEPWRVEAGLRLDAWLPAGAAGRVHPTPRLAVKRLLAGGEAAVKLAAGRYTQHLHSLRDEDLPVGLDVWVLAGARAPVVVSDQVQVGVEGYLPRGWHGGVEAYWRRFEGVVTNNFADDPDDSADDLLAGSGTARGLDATLRRDRGRVRPSLAVSWLRAERTFPDPLQPGGPTFTYAPVFDRRLDVELLLRTTLAGWETGVRWNLGTGLPYTRPLGSYTIYEYRIVDGGRRSSEGLSDPDPPAGVILGPRNGARYPAYHRLDVSFRRTWRYGWGTLSPHVDLLNLYNRKNTLFYFYEYALQPPQRSGISMFPVLPTVGLEVTF